MLEWNYPSEKLSAACRYAAGSSATTHERLRHAVSEIMLAERHMPDGDLRRRLNSFIEKCEGQPVGEEGTLAAGIARMTGDEVSGLLGEAFDFCLEVAERAAREELTLSQ